MTWPVRVPSETTKLDDAEQLLSAAHGSIRLALWQIEHGRSKLARRTLRAALNALTDHLRSD